MRMFGSYGRFFSPADMSPSSTSFPQFCDFFFLISQLDNNALDLYFYLLPFGCGKIATFELNPKIVLRAMGKSMVDRCRRTESNWLESGTSLLQTKLVSHLECTLKWNFRRLRLTIISAFFTTEQLTAWRWNEIWVRYVWCSCDIYLKFGTRLDAMRRQGNIVCVKPLER